MLDGATGRSSATGRERLPTARSCAREVDTRRSNAAPCLLGWIAPCDINILLLEAQIKHRPVPPAAYEALELEVRFCVRGVISPVIANMALDGLENAVRASAGSDRARRLSKINVIRYADDFVVTC